MPTPGNIGKMLSMSQCYFPYYSFRPRRQDLQGVQPSVMKVQATPLGKSLGGAEIGYKGEGNLERVVGKKKT